MDSRLEIFKRISEVHGELIAKCKQLVAVATQKAQQVDVRSGNLLNVARVALFIRLLSGFESTILLWCHGYLVEAHVQFRSQLEAFFRFAALCRNPDILLHYVGQDISHKEGLLRDIKNLHGEIGGPPPGAPSDAEIDQLLLQSFEQRLEIEQEFGQTLKKIKIERWATDAQEAHLFYGKYALASGHCHHAPSSLNHNLVYGEEGRVRRFVILPTTHLNHELIVDSAYVIGRALRCLLETFQLGDDPTVDELGKWIESCYAQISVPKPQKL